MTNGDKIRAMSNRELAELLSRRDYMNFSCNICPHNPITCGDIKNGCDDGLEVWLNSEVEDD